MPLSCSLRRAVAYSLCVVALLLGATLGEAGAQTSMQGVPNAMQGFSQNRDKPIQI
jgi:lipopolysaccharide export system protein LptA